MTISCGNDTQILRNRPQVLSVNMDRLAAFFRDLYPTGTAAQVASDLSVSLRTAEGWLGSNPSAPRAAVILTAITVYGPAFLVTLLPDTPDWLSEAAQNEEEARVRAQIDRLKARLKR
ncbi:MAG: hypothetical protein K5905_27865 [Roseibium sp.]|uniref:hypothetical protein n=1 Tax=Roseibium sp. TaxID=1936156 RepID=UPI002616730B|nr:hypothetical protein [Roseibium sp.]MCV0429284.1 hypothetical protein [Roseibium sp.]